MYYTIYKITNKTNGKYYIGKHQTKDLNDGYMGSGKLLRRAIEKHGIDNFTKEILHIFDNESDMNAKEKELVVISEDTYNLCPGGHGGFGYIHKKGLSGCSKGGVSKARKFRGDKNHYKNFVLAGEKTRRKRVANRDVYDVYFKHKDKITFSGRKHTLESRLKISKSNKLSQLGKNNSQYGTCWITNGQQNKKIKKEELDKWLELGYNKGRIC